MSSRPIVLKRKELKGWVAPGPEEPVPTAPIFSMEVLERQTAAALAAPDWDHYAHEAPLPAASVYFKKFEGHKLVLLPDEVIEKILEELTIVERYSLLSAVDVIVGAAIRRNIHNMESPNARKTQVIAEIYEDIELYRRGKLPLIRSMLCSQIGQAIGGAVSTITISGSTCLFASDLEFLASPIGHKSNYPNLRTIEIMNSTTFSPFALLHRASKYKLSFGQITFNLTGRHDKRYPEDNTHLWPQITQTSIAFLYAYGTKLWRHFPSVFSYYNSFGRFLNARAGYMFFEPDKQRMVRRCQAQRTPSGTLEKLTAPDQLNFLHHIAIPVLDQYNFGLKRSTLLHNTIPCAYCDLQLAVFCYTKAQLRAYRTTDNGMCILCAYDIFEGDHDDIALRKYQHNTDPNIPLVRPHWVEQLPGCHPPSKTKEYLSFHDEPEEDYESEFCDICDEQLDENEMKFRLCGQCQKENPAAYQQALTKAEDIAKDIPDAAVQPEVTVTEKIPEHHETSESKVLLTSTIESVVDANRKFEDGATSVEGVSTIKPSDLLEQSEKACNSEKGTSKTKLEGNEYNSRNDQERLYTGNVSIPHACDQGGITDESNGNFETASMSCNLSGKQDMSETSHPTLTPGNLTFEQFRVTIYAKNMKLKAQGVLCCDRCTEPIPIEEDENPEIERPVFPQPTICSWCLAVPVCHCFGKDVGAPYTKVCSHCATCGPDCDFVEKVGGTRYVVYDN